MKMPIDQLEESSNSKPVENSQNGRDEAIEKTLQEDLNLSASSIEDLLNIVNNVIDDQNFGNSWRSYQKCDKNFCFFFINQYEYMYVKILLPKVCL